MSMWGIVVAAGTGHRFGGTKHDEDLGGKLLWQWARDSLLEGGAERVIVVGPVPGGVEGGVRRQDSVAKGLAEIPGEVEYVAVHDAARPLAPASLVKEMHRLLALGDADGVVPVLPVRDTIKEVEDSARVSRTLDRLKLVAVQTPQMFRSDVLRSAHESFTGDATDDAAMVEAIGGVVMTVPGDRAGFKVTYPEDMVVANYYLGDG